jgi:hypothetical protein
VNALQVHQLHLHETATHQDRHTNGDNDGHDGSRFAIQRPRTDEAKDLPAINSGRNFTYRLGNIHIYPFTCILDGTSQTERGPVVYISDQEKCVHGRSPLTQQLPMGLGIPPKLWSSETHFFLVETFNN